MDSCFNEIERQSLSLNRLAVTPQKTFSANCFLTEVRHGEMTRQIEELGQFKPFSHYIRKRIANKFVFGGDKKCKTPKDEVGDN